MDNLKNKVIEPERKRIEDILSGEIMPITAPFNLKAGEEAYYQFTTVRMAEHENAISYSKGTVKQKGTVQRAILGDLIAGSTGAIIGGLSAEKETNSTTTNVNRSEPIDKGTMILTNKRFFFIGNQIVSIPYDDIVCVHFPHFSSMEIQYPAKIKGESYTLPDREVALYYKGIMKHIGKDKRQVKESDIERFLETDKITVPFNADGSIDCPTCETNIKDYKKRWDIFSTTKVFTCPHCGNIILK